MATASQKMIKARANLVMSHPFFGTLALRLKMVEDPSIETASCDGTSLRYNPKFVDKLPLSKVQGLIAHEVMHPAFLHHTRRGSRDKKKWNIACDYAINTILHNAKIDLPNGGYLNPAYSGMTAEHIYTLLPDDPDDGNGNGQGQGQGGNDPGGDGGVDDSPNSQNGGGSQSQQNHEEAEWKVAVAQAAHAAKQTGHLPGDIERMLEELFEPVLPWRSILRRFMTEKRNDDFSWRRGNRRFITQGLYLPSRLSDDAMGEIVVVIDTSGSISQKELTQFGNEVKGIVDEVRPSKVRVIYCDSRIAHIDEFGPDDDLQFAARGGGGTDFRPPFRWLEEHQIVPRALVYLTDGYGPFPEQEPDFPTLWCINNHDVTPPYGEHLILEV
ncbi:MAG: hydrolase [Fimbriimonadales bacterium]|nr:MAG: hydrolase [Fimbriimonadales bacterium]